MITLPVGATSDEQVAARFLNSMFSRQVVTDGPDATCSARMPRARRAVSRASSHPRREDRQRDADR